jgi:DUF2905 family protein
MNLDELGKWLLLAGIGLAALGGILWLLGRSPFLTNFPGSVQIQLGNIGCFIPLGLMIVISLVGTLVLNILIRIFNK